MRPSLAVSAPVIALLCLLSCASRDGLSPTLDQKASSVWTSTVLVEQSIVQTIGSREIATAQSFSTTYRFSLVGRGAGGELAMEASYLRISLKMKSPDGNYSFNSANDAESSASLAALRGLVGGSFTFTLRPDRRVGEIAGLPALAARIAASANDPAIAARASEYLGESSIRASLEMMFGLFPAEEVAVGDRWAIAVSSGKGALDFSRCRATAMKIDGKQLSAKVDGTIESAEEDGRARLGGSLSGNARLDTASLQILAGGITMELAGEIVVRGIKIPVKIARVTSFE
jgi:hypothetical protein